MTLGQETRWAYSAKLPSPHGAYIQYKTEVLPAQLFGKEVAPALRSRSAAVSCADRAHESSSDTSLCTANIQITAR